MSQSSETRASLLGQLSPEAALVLLLSRTPLDASGCARAEGLKRQVTNWPTFERLLGRHGVVPVVSRNLARFDPSLVPDRIARALHECTLRNAGRNVWVEHELKRILLQCSSHGFSPVVLKGPVLDRIIYGNAALREYSDLDLFVLPEDVPLTRDCLLELGYRPRVDVMDPLSTPELRHAGEWQFFRDDAPLVELHWELGGTWFAMPVTLQEAWDRAITLDLDGVPLKTLSPEDTLLFLCFHGGAMHYWNDLRWISDVAGLIESDLFGEWELLRERAVSAGCQRMTLLGLLLASSLYETPIPEDLLRQARRCPPVVTLARWVQRRIQRPEDHWPGLLETCRFRYLIFDRFRDRIRNFLGATLAPTKKDWQNRRKSVQSPSP